MNQPSLLSFDDCLQQIADSERGDGWLIACESQRRFLVCNRELIAAVGQRLRQLAEGRPVLEVCAGAGELAAALIAAGTPITATDGDPPPDGITQRMTAVEALRSFQPRTVLGCFVPVDSGVDQAVFACPTVQHYVVLGARMGPQFGSAALWQSGWSGQALDEITRWMLTRHDVWLGDVERRLIQHGEAWLFTRP